MNTADHRPALLGIRHIAIFTGALEACEKFWVETMGYQVEWKPDADNVYLTCGRDNLALHRRVGAAATPVAERLDHIGLALPTAADVDAWAAYLAARNVAIEHAPKSHRDGSRSLYFRDPGGTLVQLIHHGPISGG